MIAAVWLLLSRMIYALQLSTGSFPKPLIREEEAHYLTLSAQRRISFGTKKTVQKEKTVLKSFCQNIGRRYCEPFGNDPGQEFLSSARAVGEAAPLRKAYRRIHL